MSALAPSDRAPGLLLGPGVELPDDVTLGGNVVIYPGVVVGAAAGPGRGRDRQAPVLGRHTTTPAASTGDATTVLEPGAQVGCHAVIVAGARSARERSWATTR